MGDIIKLAWARFSVIAAVVGDVQGRIIATLFYFVIVLPFGLISRATSDPLRRRADQMTPTWLEREPVSTTLDDARLQG
ncbi:MAG: hypothetical protein HC828_19835 [Blastochloris sp.]|nr:hypothetical protein [Blastochloris sp.]